MSDDIKPSEITLNGLFTDGFGQERDAYVYANGNMQLALYPSVLYTGSASVEAVRAYIQEKVIMKYQSELDLIDVPSSWVKSSKPNDYNHDYRKGGVSRVEEAAVPRYSNIRAVVYYTVPKYTEGVQKWVAKLNDVTLSNDLAVTIHIDQYQHANKDDIEIVDLNDISDEYLTIRSMHYKPGASSVPAGHRLMKYLGNDGIKMSSKEGNESWCGNVWIPIISKEFKIPPLEFKSMCGFVDYKNNFVRFVSSSKRLYDDKEFLADTRLKRYENGNQGQSIVNGGFGVESEELSEIADAWNDGIVMALATDKFLLKGGILPGPFEDLTYEIYDPLKVADNFGNTFDIKIEWNGKYSNNESYNKWEITKFELSG